MIKITSTNDVIIVEGDELTRHYPYNGTLVIPKNSTIVVLDEKSEMVLFKSASNYDTLFTGILGSISIEDEIVTRENIIEKFNAISNVLPSGGNVDLFEVVQSLPTENISDNKVYLLLDSNGSEGNTYVEYLYVNGQWEELGKFKVNVDLSGYATEQWVNSQGFLKEHQDISNLATKAELNAKQDVISDLETIRSGAAKGATSLQSVPSEYATEQWVNSQGFLKEHQDISNLATKAELATKQDVISDLETIRSGAALGATALQSVPNGYATEQWINEQGFLKEHQDISNLATKEELSTKQDTINDLETIRSGAALGATALQSVPDTYALKSEIPDITTKQDTLVSGTNIKSINGTSLLGSGNIELATKEELATKQDVITDLDTIRSGAALGATALQSVPTGYATEQWVNEQGFLKEHQDISNLATKAELATKQDVINDLETIRSGAALGATALQSVPDTYALKSEIPDITTKQDTLVSGTNIKTINGNSLLGSGNIEVAANVDLSNLATKEELNTKQDTLVSGTNIKSINGTSLLGAGNIEVAKEWIGTQAEYDALSTKDNNTTYYITE